MLYVDFIAGDKAYKLRLNTRNTVMLEKTLGRNPIGIFDTKGESLPSITDMVSVLFASMQQYHHGITLNDAYDIFDDYLADGHTVTDFVSVILDIYRESGIIPKNTKETAEKN